jgi:DNA-binding HxlR family transcriptional regulator
MRHTALADQQCSIARTVAILGERWTMVILRQAFLGARRFEDYQAPLEIARNMLTDRLRSLVEHGILERRLYHERPPRYEYRLTRKGLDLYPILVTMMEWGDRYGGFAGPPMELRHHCGDVTHPQLVCDCCGESLDPHHVVPEPGPGTAAPPPPAVA